MAGCGCSNGQQCACHLAPGPGLDFEGAGTERQPYVPVLVPLMLGGAVTGNSEVTVTGTGQPGDPWIVTATVEDTSVVSTIFSVDGTWFKPGGGTFARVIVIGGGGGGSADQATSGGATTGPEGGDGGSMSTALFRLAALPASVDVTVGPGGSGGLGSISSLGGTGGDSYYGPYLRAEGGAGGGKARKLSGSTPEGGTGGRGGGPGADAEDAYNGPSPRGGGRGHGNGDPATAGGQIFVSEWDLGGEGGDGSPAPLTNGEDGELYGGGGGGADEEDSNGGNGADGIVIVTVW